MDKWVGKNLKHYRLTELIDEGGTSMVFKAYDFDTGMTVAIKVLNEGTSRGRFRREVRAVVRLDHPHILPVFDYDLKDSPAYLVMPYIEGGTLRDLLKARRLSLREVVEMFGQIARALDYAHEEGILHRDIKPGNILIDENGTPKLADFGIAKEYKIDETVTHWVSRTSTGLISGTPPYMAPEHAQGKGNKHSDIYSLGVVLFEMLVGDVPYRAENPWDLINMHVYAPIPKLRNKRADIPEAMEAVVQKALAKNPEHRFATAGEMAQALEDAFNHQIRPRLLPEHDTTTEFQFLKRDDAQTTHWSSDHIAPLIPDTDLEVDDIRWEGVAHAVWLLFDSWSFDDDLIEDMYGSRLRPLLTRIITQGIFPPARRAQMGGYLSRLYDNRKGVGVLTGTDTGPLLPDIDWVKVEDDDWLMSGQRQHHPFPSFHIARYPVTYQQFRGFLTARDGYRKQNWWQGLGDVPLSEDEPPSMYWNHPHTLVSWYDAIAFCRWLSVKLLDCPELLPPGTHLPAFDMNDPFTWAVRLPTGREWQRAARGTDERKYPWGGDYITDSANTNELVENDGPYYLEATTPVGMYPKGASPFGVLDMCGNVWEWCLNEYYNPDTIHLNGSELRELRGGSWADPPHNASCVFHEKTTPNHRSAVIGFRLVAYSKRGRELR